MDIFFGRKTVLSVSSHPLLPLCSLQCLQLCPWNGLVSLMWKSSQNNQNQHKLFKKWGFYLLLWSVFAWWPHWQLSQSAPAQYGKDRMGTATALAAKEILMKQASGQGPGGVTRLAWLLCRHGDGGDFQSLLTLPTAGPLHTPYVLPLIASPSCWMRWSSLLFPASEIAPTLRWGQHLRSCRKTQQP